MIGKLFEYAIIAIIVLFIITLSLVLPARKNKENYKGMISFDVDNTMLCHGAMMGNEKCNRGSARLGFTGAWELYPEFPCGTSEMIHPPYYNPSTKAWTESPQISYNPNNDNTFGGNQPKFDGRCLKEEELKDGRDLTCSIHAPNGNVPDPNNCSLGVNEKGMIGVDCNLKSRIIKIIKMCRDKNIAISINTAEFKEDAVSKLNYYKALGFTDEEIKFPEDGGNLTYNVSRGVDLFTQAKQKAINLTVLGKKFNLPNDRILLVDDQMINVKACRDMGFRAYNCSTTFGETYGWSCDSVPNHDPTANSSCQCGITDNQITDIFEKINDW